MRRDAWKCLDIGTLEAMGDGNSLLPDTLVYTIDVIAQYLDNLALVLSLMPDLHTRASIRARGSILGKVDFPRT
jgi:hypothetical protein